MVIFPPALVWTPSRSESSWEVFATLIVAVAGFVLVVLLLDKFVELTFVLVVPLVVDLTVVLVVLLVVDKVGDLIVVLVVPVLVLSVAGGGGSSKAGALLSD